MRRLMPLILALLLTPAVHARSTEAASAAEELTQLLKYFLDGASRNDVAVHDRFWADDLIYTRSAGVRVGKADILANARTGPHSEAADPTKYTAEDIRIQQYGDTAVVAFRLVGTMGSGEQAVVMQYLNTGTFARRGGEWRAVAWQATRVPEPEEGGAPPQRPEPKKEAAINLTPGAVARPGLYEEILKADAEFFKAFFDTCDIETVRRYLADDFEMFHDKGGLVSTSGAEFVKITQDKCKRQEDGTDFLSTRKLVPESMKVYALNNYGAIQIGTHRFYALQKDKPDRLTETGEFTHVWKEEKGQWNLARVLSYDHVLAQ
jgi:ketosteroid isomerase-like protein